MCMGGGERGGGWRSNGKSASRSVETRKILFVKGGRAGGGLGSKSRAIKRSCAIMLTISRRRTLYNVVLVSRVSVSRQKKGTWKIVNRMCFSRVSKSIYILVFNNIYIYIIYITMQVCMYDKCERVDVCARLA